MKQLPHTPGNWRVKQKSEFVFVIVNDNGLVVAEINGPYLPTFDRYKADAALIAAAPALLEACKLMVSWLVNDNDADDFSTDDLLAVLRLAIERTVVVEDEDDGA